MQLHKQVIITKIINKLKKVLEKLENIEIDNKKKKEKGNLKLGIYFEYLFMSFISELIDHLILYFVSDFCKRDFCVNASKNYKNKIDWVIYKISKFIVTKKYLIFGEIKEDWSIDELFPLDWQGVLNFVKRKNLNFILNRKSKYDIGKNTRNDEKIKKIFLEVKNQMFENYCFKNLENQIRNFKSKKLMPIIHPKIEEYIKIKNGNSKFTYQNLFKAWKKIEFIKNYFGINEEQFEGMQKLFDPTGKILYNPFFSSINDEYIKYVLGFKKFKEEFDKILNKEIVQNFIGNFILKFRSFLRREDFYILKSQNENFKFSWSVYQFLCAIEFFKIKFPF